LIITYHALDVAKWIYDDLRSDKNWIFQKNTLKNLKSIYREE
jgi:hypothetical protein